MMTKKRIPKPITATLSALVLATIAVPAPAMAPGFAMLDRIQKGAWQLTGSGASKRICLRSGEELFALHHRQSDCTRYVIKNTPGEVTVHLTCGPAGHARTTLRYETPRLIQIDTSGVEDRSPFADSFEARAAGRC